MTEGARLKSIRQQLDAIAPGDWSLASDKAGTFVEAAGRKGELLPVARFDAIASTDEMQFVAAAPATVRFLLGLVDRAIEAMRPTEPARQPGKDYAAEAAMKCAEPFRVFLEQCHGLERPLTDERVAQKVRSLIGVTSRRELNQDSAAADRWRDLVRAFDAWGRETR